MDYLMMIDKEKLLNNPTWNAGDTCVYCGNPNVQKHHVIYGSCRRKKSDKYGYVIPLCYEHHIGGDGIHFNRDEALRWIELAQEHFERHHGTRADFIKEFGRSYL